MDKFAGSHIWPQGVDKCRITEQVWLRELEEILNRILTIEIEIIRKDIMRRFKDS